MGDPVNPPAPADEQAWIVVRETGYFSNREYLCDESYPGKWTIYKSKAKNYRSRAKAVNAANSCNGFTEEIKITPEMRYEEWLREYAGS